MKNTIPEIDAYIAKAPDFAKPILERIRKLVHKAHPDIQEVIKWSVPHFEHKGLVCAMAAFKQHVRFVFWRGQDIRNAKGDMESAGDTPISALKVEKLADLPPDRVVIAYVKDAIKINDAKAANRKSSKTKTGAKRKPAKTLKPPADLLAALKKHKKAHATFEKFSPSARNEYVDWITEAKQAETRAKRLATAIEWMAEGKPRNWKYMKEWR